MRGQAGDLKNIAARKQLKANAIKKLIFCGLFLALILGLASAALAQEFAEDFDELKRILTFDYSSPTELTVQISEDKDIYLKGAIKVNRNVTKLTIDLNGRTIDGFDGKKSHPFLQFDGTCDLTLTNTSTDTSEMGEIQNCRGDDGAVIYFGNVDNAKITLQNIVFSNNVAKYGGGVVYAGGSNCTFTAKGCVFDNNGAESTNGGAIDLYDSSTCDISYCEFSYNYAEEFGGALSAGADNTINISHCSFKKHYSNYNDGGAVHVGDSTILQVNNTVFSDNVAYGQGGAIWQGDSVQEKIGTGVLIIENCKFDLNVADDFGGAVQTKALKEIVINNSDFTYNESDYGGAVGIFGTKATLKSCVFSHNEAYSYGGAICNDSLDLGVDGCNFTENSAYAGGAIADPFYRFLTLIQGSYEVDESDVVHNSEIKNSTFSKNTAEYGGAVFESTGVGNEQYYFDEQKRQGYYITSDEDDGYEPGRIIPLTSTPGNHVKIINSQFLENEAAKCGGAVYHDNPLDTVISGGNTRIEKNKAGTSGGAVYVVNSGTFAIHGAPFTDNTDETKNTAPIGKDISLLRDSTIMFAGNLGTNVYDVAKYDLGIHRPGVITSGLSGKGTKENFKSSEGYTVIINSNNEAELVSAYTVTFQSNGGSGNMEEQVIPSGTTQNLTGNTFEREHYIFKRWNTSADGTGTSYEDEASISLSNNLTLYAQWEAKKVYSITWQMDDGSVIDTTTVEYGAVPTHADPVKKQTEEYTYTFAGWTPEVAAVSGEATYKAAFTQKKRSYPITWQMDDDSVIDTVLMEYGTMPAHDAPVKESDADYIYTFSKWTPDPVSVSGPATYKAQFTATPKTEYTVIWLNGDGTELDRRTYKEGAEEPATDKTPVKAEDAENTYTFSGWDSGKVEGNVKTYAPRFTATAKKVYTVILSSDGNGAASADPASGTEGTGVTLTATPKEGYRFKEWQVITGGVTITDNQFSIERENVELKAIFELTAPKEYAFTKGDGSSWTKGSGTPLDFTVKGSPDDTATFQNFTGIDVDGKTVAGWNYTTAPGSVNISLKPGYLEDMTPGIHKITANFTDGSAVASFTVNYKVPKTGDEGKPMLWLSCVLAGSVMITVSVYAKKRKKTVSK